MVVGGRFSVDDPGGERKKFRHRKCVTEVVQRLAKLNAARDREVVASQKPTFDFCGAAEQAELK